MACERIFSTKRLTRYHKYLFLELKKMNHDCLMIIKTEKYSVGVYVYYHYVLLFDI